MAKRRIRFMSGERFRLKEEGLTKSAAQSLARKVRKEGRRNLARVIKGAKGWDVWWSPHDWFVK